MARRSSRFIRPVPRTKMWIGYGTAPQVLAGSTTTLFASYSAGALLLRPFTILRTLAEILFTSDQEAVDENTVGSLGEIVVTDTAAALGVTALPNPSSIDGDPEASWYVWQALHNKFVIDTGSQINGAAGQRYTIDSKAMRKVGPDDDSATLIDIQSAPGALVFMHGRQLIQLH